MRTLIFTLLGASNAFSLTSWASARSDANRPTASTRTKQEMRYATLMLEPPSICCRWLFALKMQNTRNPDPRTALHNSGHVDRASGAGARADHADSYTHANARERRLQAGVGNSRHTL